MFPSVPRLVEVLSQPFKRSQEGLFHGKTKQYGNNVPFSKHKTRRTWLPNVQRKRIFSDTLGKNVRVKVTTRALRTIKKHGGLDTYVEKTRSDILGQEGMRLRLLFRTRAEEQERQIKIENLGSEERLGVVEARKERRLLRKRILSGSPEVDPKPSLESARQQRLEVGKVLGLGEGVPASPSQTIDYIREQRKQQPYQSLHQ